MQLREMTDNACIEFLANHMFGHLGCSGEQYPYIVPIHYAYEGRRLFMFSMPGLKIDRLRANPWPVSMPKSSARTESGKASSFTVVSRS